MHLSLWSPCCGSCLLPVWFRACYAPLGKSGSERQLSEALSEWPTIRPERATFRKPDIAGPCVSGLLHASNVRQLSRRKRLSTFCDLAGSTKESNH
jgi:hypothetical protein